MIKRMLSLFLGAILAFCLASPALAEDCFFLSVDRLDMDQLRSDDYVAEHLSSDAAAICVQKYISDSPEFAAQVRLTLMQMDTQTLILDKNYGYQSGTFDSGTLYLPYAGNRTVPYLVTLYVGEWVYAMPFMHLQPRLQDNSACSYGVRLRDLNPALTQDWLMGTMVDLAALRTQGSMVIPLCASSSFWVGQATVTLQGDSLTVMLAFQSGASVDVYQCSIYCIRDVGSLTTVDPAYMTEPAYQVGQPMDVNGANTVLLYMPMQLSYDPASLSPMTYDPGDPALQQQWALWNQNLMEAQQTWLPEATQQGPQHGQESSWAPLPEAPPQAILEGEPPEEPIPEGQPLSEQPMEGMTVEGQFPQEGFPLPEGGL